MAHLPTSAYRLQQFGLNTFATLTARIGQMTAAGQNVIRLDMGSPDLPPPSAVADALAASAHDPSHHGYSPFRGDAGFRQAVAEYYMRRFNVLINPDIEVLPLLGSKEGIINLSLAYLDRGDSALIPSIAYPAYESGARMAGADVHSFPIRPENGYLPNFTDDPPLTGLDTAKLLWINYPNNPTGAVADLDTYARALEFCRAHDLLLCADNPYVEVTFDGYKAHSALEVPGAKEQTVEFISLSKSHNMAGWRLGACVGNAEALNTLLHIKSTGDSGHFRAVYDAGTQALNGTPQSWLDERNARYAARRDRIMAALPEIGLSAEMPHGSLYIWAKVLHGLSEIDYTEMALTEAHVSLTPGSIYGADGAGYVRFSLGIAEARLDDALDRLREWYRVRV